MALDPNDKIHQLGGALADTIQRFTNHTPMTAEDVIEALCFIAGHAAGQKVAHSAHNSNELRQMGVAAIDKGLEEARNSMKRGSLILPN